MGTGARDGEAKVRGQAMFALGELAGNCQPEMSAHAREALPCVFAAMAEDNPTLQQQACYALDSFCEHLGTHLRSIHACTTQKLPVALASSCKHN